MGKKAGKRKVKGVAERKVGKGKSKSKAGIKEKAKKKKQQEAQADYDIEALVAAGYSPKGGPEKKTKKKQTEFEDEFDIEAGSQSAASNENYDGVYKSKFVQFIFLIKALTVFGAINMIIGQFVGGLNNNSIGFIPAIMRIYVVMFSVMVIMNESGLGQKIVKGSAIFSNWVIRGAFYTFIGVAGLEQNSLANEEATNVYLSAVAWYMIVLGALYTVMGLFCLQAHYTRLVPNADEIAQDAKTALTGKAQELQEKRSF